MANPGVHAFDNIPLNLNQGKNKLNEILIYETQIFKAHSPIAVYLWSCCFTCITRPMD